LKSLERLRRLEMKMDEISRLVDPRGGNVMNWLPTIEKVLKIAREALEQS
jgi:hypothetical protein